MHDTTKMPSRRRPDAPGPAGDARTQGRVRRERSDELARAFSATLFALAPETRQAWNTLYRLVTDTTREGALDRTAPPATR